MSLIYGTEEVWCVKGPLRPPARPCRANIPRVLAAKVPSLHSKCSRDRFGGRPKRS